MENKSKQITFGLFSRMLLALFILLLFTVAILSTSLLRGASEQFDAFRLEHTLAMAHTLSDGSVDALITEDYELLERFVKSSLPTHAGAYAYFTRPNGQILSSTDLDLIAKKIILPEELKHSSHRELIYKGRPIIEVIEKTYVGKQYIANAHIAYFTDEENFNYLVQAKGIIIPLFIMFIVISVGSYIIVLKIRTPILSLIHTIENTSHDAPINLPKRMYWRTDEVGTLARAFDSVFNQLSNANKEVIIARDAALDASKLKSEFLSNISHELRTPLHAVTAYENLLSTTELNEKQTKYCNNIGNGAKQLLELITDILDFSSFESGKLEIENQLFSINDAFNEIHAITLTNAENKKLELTYFINEDVPKIVYADLKCLRKIIIILINNGIKFTEQGSVKINVSSKLLEQGERQLNVTISDTGIGIEKSEFERIFIPFYQIDGSATRAQGGTGLGLAMTKKMRKSVV